jgi:hypothetical protein
MSTWWGEKIGPAWANRWKVLPKPVATDVVVRVSLLVPAQDVPERAISIRVVAILDLPSWRAARPPMLAGELIDVVVLVRRGCVRDANPQFWTSCL